MNKDIMEGDWKQLKGKVQQKWGKLTDDHMEQIKGSREQLSGMIQKNYGLTIDAAKKQIDEFEKGLNSKH